MTWEDDESLIFRAGNPENTGPYEKLVEAWGLVRAEQELAIEAFAIRAEETWDADERESLTDAAVARRADFRQELRDRLGPVVLAARDSALASQVSDLSAQLEAAVSELGAGWWSAVEGDLPAAPLLPQRRKLEDVRTKMSDPFWADREVSDYLVGLGAEIDGALRATLDRRASELAAIEALSPDRLAERVVAGKGTAREAGIRTIVNAVATEHLEDRFQAQLARYVAEARFYRWPITTHVADVNRCQLAARSDVLDQAFERSLATRFAAEGSELRPRHVLEEYDAAEQIHKSSESYMTSLRNDVPVAKRGGMPFGRLVDFDQVADKVFSPFVSDDEAFDTCQTSAEADIEAVKRYGRELKARLDGPEGPDQGPTMKGPRR